MAFKNHSFRTQAIFFFFLIIFFSYIPTSSADFDDIRLGIPSPASNVEYFLGSWSVVQTSIGISAMHMQLLRNNKVVIFDGLEVGPSNLSLPNHQCLHVTRHAVVRTRTRGSGGNSSMSMSSKIVSIPATDCTAHSVLYDVVSNTFRPLTLRTNTWCSSGAVLPDGTLVQAGGFGEDGIRKIRTLSCSEPGGDDTESCDWIELAFPALSQRRWYASSQILPDGRVIVVGGRQSFSYEYFPKRSDEDSSSFYMRFLVETVDPYEENNLYPFLHLLPDGTLFVFANNRSVAFDYRNNTVVRRFPIIPGGFKRSYPNTGSSVLLPIRLEENPPIVEIMICGGAPSGAFRSSDRYRVFLAAARTCGRLRVSDKNPQWSIEDMPSSRVMPDMLILPTGDVLLVNGASRGTAGWNNAVLPVLTPFLYVTDGIPTRRFFVLDATKTARMYHSSAVLLPGGSILVGGSNPHRRYNFSGKPYPTELSLEIYRPYYLHAEHAEQRPSILTVEAGGNGGMSVAYGEPFGVTMVLRDYRGGGVSVALVAPSFSTHSFAMNQRMVVLHSLGLQKLSDVAYKATARGPPTRSVAPPGYYMLFLVHAGIPSEAVWVRLL